jgi:hypothetical protein
MQCLSRRVLLLTLAVLTLAASTGCDGLGLWGGNGDESLGRIVFTAWEPTETGRQRFVYTMNTDGSDLQRLTFPDDTLPCGPDQERECGGGTAYRACWGPEGERIAYTGSFGPEEFHITVMNADGSDKRAIAGFTGGSADKPRWSPEGERLLIRQRELLGIITGTYVIDIDGSGKTCILCTDGEPVTFQGDTLSASTAQWGPTSDLLYLFSYPDDVERPDQFDSLYLFRISTREVVRKVASIDLQEGLSIGPHGTISRTGSESSLPMRETSTSPPRPARPPSS